jgi:UV excision repair protein RAD23
MPGIPPGAHVVRLTEEEAAAVQRLQDMLGVSRQQAAEAYLACDKNEQLAANFLLNSM